MFDIEVLLIILIKSILFKHFLSVGNYKKQKILFVILISKIFPNIKLIYTISPLKPRGKMLPSYERHTLLFLCCGTEALFSPGWENLDNHPPSESGSTGSGSASRPEAPASWSPCDCILSPLHQPSN